MRTNYFILLLALSTLVACSDGTNNQKPTPIPIPSQEAVDTSKPTTPKQFKEADTTAVLSTKFVIEDQEEITEVRHAVNGEWQFSGKEGFGDFIHVVRLVKLGQLTKMDKTLVEIADMPPRYIARRKHKGDPWIVQREN